MRWMSIALAVAATSGVAGAQEAVQHDVLVVAPPAERTTVTHTAMPAAPGAGAQMNVEWIAAELGGKVVKGAPYSGEEVTETRQVLADGNRIVRKNTVLVYRDSEGRTRREMMLSAAGPWSTDGGNPIRSITISDPVAGVTYSLDPNTRTARKLPTAEYVPSFRAQTAGGGAPSGQVQHTEVIERRIEIVKSGEMAAHAPAAGVQVMLYRNDDAAAPARESLGTQVIEGVTAEGTRVTVTIPAGRIGNEKPIQTVSETWYSPQLQTVVMSRQSDPRMGETEFRLTKVNPGEPSAALFQIPADYKVVQGGTILFRSEAEK